MNYEGLKQELANRGISLRQIAREIQVSHTSVILTCRGDRRSRFIESQVAQRLDKSPEEIWDKKYRKEIK